ncbi:MAG: ABC transporter permease [Lachnospiraceae bacterium]
MNVRVKPKFKFEKISKILGPLIALLVLALLLTIVTDQFFKASNLLNILRQASINALVAFGMLFVLLTGGIDLSVGATIASAGCVIGIAIKAGITNTFLLLLIGLLCGAIIGLVNGLLFTKLDLPHPFVSTLGTQLFIRGFCLYITGSASLSGFSKGVMFLGSESFLGFPICFLLVIVVGILSSLFLNKTAYGRYIYSIGGNREVARLSGIPVKPLLNLTYVLSGVLAALAGIVMIGRVSLAYPTAGEGYEMNAIAACVIGGASFNGGKGSVSGTLIGALIIAVLNNGLNLLGAQSDVQKMILGLVVILAVLVDVVRGKQELKARRLKKAVS